MLLKVMCTIPNYITTMPHPDVFWYHLKGMCTQKNMSKNVLETLFPYIFYIKTKWNIVYEYLKTKIFSRDTSILPQMHWTSNIFVPSATTIGEFWVPLNYLIFNLKKKVCPKNLWMWYWTKFFHSMKSFI